MQKVLDMISKSHFIKEKKPDKLNFTKTENLYSVKDIVKKMKRQAIGRKSLSHISDEGLDPDYVKNSQTLKINNPTLKKWADLNKHSP